MRSRIPQVLIAHITGSPRLWIMLTVASLMAYWFAGVTDFVFDGAGEDDQAADEAEREAFDKAIGKFFQQFRSVELTTRAIDLTALGSGGVLMLFALIALSAVIGAKDYRGLVHLTLAMAGAFLWPEFLKGLFERERPDGVLHLVHVGNTSFPSGHSFGAAACYATFAFFFGRYVPRLGIEIFCYALAAFIVVLVGITRVYLGVHYATDVMAGITAGAAWAFFLAAVFSFWYRQPEPKAK